MNRQPLRIRRGLISQSKCLSSLVWECSGSPEFYRGCIIGVASAQGEAQCVLAKRLTPETSRLPLRRARESLVGGGAYGLTFSGARGARKTGSNVTPRHS